MVWTVAGTRASCVVNVNWNGDEWNVNTWKRDDNDWNAGNRVFSPETGDCPGISRSGDFRFNTLSPPAELLTRIIEALRDFSIASVIQGTDFPCEL